MEDNGYIRGIELIVALEPREPRTHDHSAES